MKKGTVKRAVLSTILCNTLVWYDYILFGSLASTIGDLFFPQEDKYLSLMSSFSVFAVGFCMRPFGASIFGHIGDKYGRRTALVISIIAMSVPIGFMAVVPTYASVGVLAPILLVICRLVQGFSLGGEAGNATFLIEHSKANQAGLFGSFEVLSAVLGSVFALAVKMASFYFTGDEFKVWGWRIPFIVGFVIGIISIFIRVRAGESPAYTEHASKESGVVKSPVKHLFKYYRRPLILAICIDCIENCSFHIFMVFFISFVGNFSLSSAVNPQIGEFIEIVNVMISGVMTVGFGALSDVIGRKKVMGGASIALFFLAIPVFWLLSQESFWYVGLGYFLFAIPFAATLGPSSAAMSELFPTKVRYTGFGIARNISSALGGGMAPVLCTWLMQITGWKVAPGFCVMFWALIACIALSRITPKDIHRDWVKQ
ncbi:MFS transporter [Anaplasma phagocytophilum]|uniref:Major facilitator family transporter n=9 Tax=Anaplasma phagocytophilum TaxID=948 RepID=Q2GLR5_ANAPZ|nr:MFS transporter [Anaplasma phagocytophilum]KJZ98569.1 sugar (and other) transporter family protein [Anaplasma phagocytophilum str. CR1007]ABD44363.1 major facilitator family transporter [Anaplasma phagocytophilum str. HZ]AGR78570.1 membrane protein [Anaplasma phagocytophilum str. HZ2]AGR79817.1 membrane protein [Anaplasma phagocytophilum str. JM]AGR81073.1 membrane protein [Anaplasma phagocytophilum str. Dog2]